MIMMMPVVCPQKKHSRFHDGFRDDNDIDNNIEEL